MWGGGASGRAPHTFLTLLIGVAERPAQEFAAVFIKYYPLNATNAIFKNITSSRTPFNSPFEFLNFIFPNVTSS